MTDREKASLRGPVHTVRTENQKPPYLQTVTFNPEGNMIEQGYHSPNGSVSKSILLYGAGGRVTEIHSQVDDGPVTRTVFSYDITGRLMRQSVQQADGTYWDLETYRYETDERKSKVTFIRPELLKMGASPSFAIDGFNHSYSAEGSTTMTTLYNSVGKAVEVHFHDDKHTMISRITLTYDPDGKLLEESQYSGDESPVDEVMKHAEFTPQQQKVLGQMFKLRALLSRAEYTYNKEGSCIERHSYLDDFGETRTAFLYDGHGNKTEETHTEERTEGRAFEIDEEGNKINDVGLDTGSTRNYQIRYEYEYDPQGNWTRRVTSTRHAPTEPFQVSNTESRVITYYSSVDSLP